MRYLSVCSGIEAATVAWHPLGFEAAAFAEIEAFPSAVLEAHYPEVPNLGDMERFNDWRLSDVDVLVGGTPCQSFSVAGLRGGMDDPRGNLALVYLAIADRFRPEWLVWENVPGVLSSNEGRDFGAFLGALGKLGYGWAYRVLDAQFFGVPQRRRRVFVVGHLGGWQRAAAVLFERESLRRNPAPSREAGEGIASALAASPSSGRSPNVGSGQGNVVTAKAVRTPSGGIDREDMHTLVTHSLSAEGCDASEDGTGRGTPLVADPIQANEARTYCNSVNNPRPHNLIAAPLTGGGTQGANAPGRRKEDDENLVVSGADLYNGELTGDVAATLGAAGSSVNASSPTVFAQNQRDECRELTVAGSLSAIRRGDAKNETLLADTPVAFTEGAHGVTENYTTDPIQSGGGKPGQGYQAVRCVSTVRRLTPRECERLQGFPDNYTLIEFRGKPASDTPRYRALGNSMAVPVMRWIGERLLRVSSEND